MNGTISSLARIAAIFLALGATPYALDVSAAERQPASGDVQPAKADISPQQKMEARFPQPVKVGDLLGLPVLDEEDSTIGFVQSVVVCGTGGVCLIVPYASRFGWIKGSPFFVPNRRLVAVPIESVAILGRQIAALDMNRMAFEAAPDWAEANGNVIGSGVTVRIAIANR